MSCILPLRYIKLCATKLNQRKKPRDPALHSEDTCSMEMSHKILNKDRQNHHVALPEYKKKNGKYEKKKAKFYKYSIKTARRKTKPISHCGGSAKGGTHVCSFILRRKVKERQRYTK